MSGWIQDRKGEKDAQGKERKGRRWVARYRVDGRVVSRSFERKGDAERWLTDEMAKVNRGDWINPRAGVSPYGEWAKKWLAGHAHSVSPKTLAGYESLLRSRILPTFEHIELRRITAERVRRWVAGMARQGLSPTRIRQAHQVLSASLEVAVDDGLIAKNPCGKVKLPRLVKRRELFLTAGQVAALVHSAEARQRGAGTLVLFLAYSGLRWGEATALRPSSINTETGRVRITDAWSEVGGNLVLGTTKTHKARTTFLPSFVAEALEVHMSAGSGEWVFPAPGGGVLRSSNFRRVWLPAVASADGIPKGLHVHDLRHTAASLMIATGAPIKVVQNALGHASAAMTLDVYGHLYPDDAEDLAARMDAKYRDAARTSNVVSMPIVRSEV